MPLTLLRGSFGPDVESLQSWLVGQGVLTVIDGRYGAATERAVKEAQRIRRLQQDGIVGPTTRAAFIEAGWLAEPLTVRRSYPPRPNVQPLTAVERQRIWGQIVAVPLDDRSNVRITNSWPRDHLKTVTVPQLVGIDGAPPEGKVLWHKNGVRSLLGFFADIERAGKLRLVKSWSGSWVPRFVRGSTTTLSSHAHATAFDINAAWNGLGQAPARQGEPGSVVELVPIALAHGFFWGGWFSRPDGMHLELMKPDE